MELEQAIEEAVYAWSRQMKWFPQDPQAQVDIAGRILVWVSGDAKKVEWLRGAVLTQMREWICVDALRQLFLSHYPMPAGVEQYSPEAGTYYLDGGGDTRLKVRHDDRLLRS